MAEDVHTKVTEIEGRRKSPAPFSKEIIEVLRDVTRRYLPAGSLVLDPFAGVGGVHGINDGPNDPYEILCIELEPEWAEQCAEKGPTWCGDFLQFCPPEQGLFDAVVTSPTYANRLADHHNAKDGSHRRTYKHYLGRDPTDGNSGVMQWGAEYKAFHWYAWKKAARGIKKGGLLILNIKDHPRRRVMQPVSAWHEETIIRQGFELVEKLPVGTPGYRYGENKEQVMDHEWVMVFKKI